MGRLCVVTLPETRMESSNTPASKTERKIIEKNRRNHMKNLYSKLNSLLPNQGSKETLSLPDQIDEAINYIKSLQANLQKTKEKKENLTGKKRSNTSTYSEHTASSRSPEIKIREMGPALEVVLTSGLNDQFMFYEIIRMLHEEAAEVMNASSSVIGNSIFHIVHAEIKDNASGFGTVRISKRLNEFVYGSRSEVESQEGLWSFEMHSEIWKF